MHKVRMGRGRPGKDCVHGLIRKNFTIQSSTVKDESGRSTEGLQEPYFRFKERHLVDGSWSVTPGKREKLR